MSIPPHLAKRWLIIINPQAGNGLVQKKWPQLKANLKQILPNLKIVSSRQVEDLNLIVSTAIKQGIRHILAIGGDGSAHQVVNAIMNQNLVPSTDITFAILPLGTGNDWIKTHKIPKKWAAWKTMFIKGTEHYQNVGLLHYQKNNHAQKKYFINVAGLAYDAFVIKESENKSSFLKGRLYYLWLGLICLPKYTTQQASLNYDGIEINQRFYTINVGIGQYSGGGMQLVPHATTESDYFGLTYVGHLSRISVFLNSFRFYKGRIANFKKAILVKTKKIMIHSTENMLIEADGEYLGQCPVSIELIPRALKFIGE